MSEEKKVEEIDWKKFSHDLLFSGLIPAFQQVTDKTENTIDDLVLKGVDGIAKLFLSEEEKKEEA